MNRPNHNDKGARPSPLMPPDEQMTPDEPSTHPKPIKPPRVSVIIPIYNAERFISKTINSILRQTFTDFELIALNDGSTDSTIDILQDLARNDPRIVIVDKPNEGLVKTLNIGISHARAPLIARIDHDDLALPTRLEKQFEFLDQNPDFIGCGCLIQNIGPDGERLGNPNTAPRKLIHDPAAFPPLQMWLYGPTPMIRTDALKQVGGYREQFATAEDRDLCWRLGAVGKLHMVPEILVLHRLHDTNLSVTMREPQLLAGFFSDLSAICAHFQIDDTDVLVRISQGEHFEKTMRAYTKLLDGRYDVKTYWLLYLARLKAWDIGGFTGPGQFIKAIARHVLKSPIDPNRRELLRKATPHMLKRFRQPISYKIHR